MNFLAHSFLSFSDEQIVGQFLEDYIRNKERYSFSKDIQDGITMHRAIDTFTDSHPAIHEAKKVFSPLVRLYSGAFVDVSIDYFLANDFTLKTLQGWKDHSKHVYKVLNQHLHLFPENFKLMLSRMESEDWLYNYRVDKNIGFSMKNVLHKAKYLEKDIPVFEAFLEHKKFLKECYDNFFQELYLHAKTVNDMMKKI